MADGEFKRRRVVFLEQKQNLNSLNQQLAARQNQLTDTRYSLQQLPTVMAGKIQGLRSELATNEQRIAEIGGRRAYVIRAPAAGRVSMLQANVGQFAEPRRLQMEIVPNDSVLQAELFVPTRAIGFMQLGQEVRILYDAFPYQQFGTYSGRIVKISDDTDQVRHLWTDRAQRARLQGHSRARPAGHRRLPQEDTTSG